MSHTIGRARRNKKPANMKTYKPLLSALAAMLALSFSTLIAGADHSVRSDEPQRADEQAVQLEAFSVSNRPRQRLHRRRFARGRPAEFADPRDARRDVVAHAARSSTTLR